MFHQDNKNEIYSTVYVLFCCCCFVFALIEMSKNQPKSQQQQQQQQMRQRCREKKNQKEVSAQSSWRVKYLGGIFLFGQLFVDETHNIAYQNEEEETRQQNMLFLLFIVLVFLMIRRLKKDTLTRTTKMSKKGKKKIIYATVSQPVNATQPMSIGLEPMPSEDAIFFYFQPSLLCTTIHRIHNGFDCVCPPFPM